MVSSYNFIYERVTGNKPHAVTRSIGSSVRLRCRLSKTAMPENEGCIIIEHWLRVIAGKRRYTAYSYGVKLFMKNWHKKTGTEKTRLSSQIAEVIKADERFAINVFGAQPVAFFKTLVVSKIIGN